MIRTTACVIVMSLLFMQGPPVASAAVGFMLVRAAARDDSGRRPFFDLALWYPTDSASHVHSYSFANWDVQSSVAVNARPRRGDFPLVVFSHDGAGAATSSFFLLEGLVRAGFVVAAPDHDDPSLVARSRRRLVLTKHGKRQTLHWLRELQQGRYDHDAVQTRARQVSAAIDTVLTMSLFKGCINRQAIGLLGHGLGATTVQQVVATDRRASACALISPWFEQELASSAPAVVRLFPTKRHYRWRADMAVEFPRAADYLSRDPVRGAMLRDLCQFFALELAGKERGGE